MPLMTSSRQLSSGFCGMEAPTQCWLSGRRAGSSPVEVRSVCTDFLQGPFEVLPMPEFKSNEIPENLAVEVRVFAAVKLQQMVQKRRAEVTALPGARIHQNVHNERFQPRILQKPERDRDTESVFFLVEDIVREDCFHGFFEDKALFKAPHLQRCRDTPGKFSEPVIKQRKARTYAGHLSSAKHFAQVVVSQSHLDVEIQQAVQIIVGRGGTKVFLRNI